MAFVHSFNDVYPPVRLDGIPWTRVRVEQSDDVDGPWTQVYDQPIVASVDPAKPTAVDITVTAATIESGFFRFRFVDAATSVSPYVGTQYSPVDLLVTDPSWAPTVAAVADLTYERTKDRGGNYQGTFTDQTNPTAIRVSHLIDVAQDHVISDIGGNPTMDKAKKNARHMTAIYTAMLIEISHYAEQITRDISPYKELRKLYEAALGQLEDLTKPDQALGADDGSGGATYHFDGFAVGYKGW